MTTTNQTTQETPITEDKQINYIHLVSNFYYTASSDQYTLVQKVIKNRCEGKTKIQTGETYEGYSNPRYFTTLTPLLDSCVNQLNRQLIESGEITTLKQCVEQINSTRQQLINIIKA